MIKPFYRPRRVDPVARMQRGLHGNCYEYAFKEALRYMQAGSPLPVLYVVHGLYEDCIEHAWVERDGSAYDWQMFASGRRAEPSPVAQFYEETRARKLTVYTAQEVLAAVEKNGHSGPWTTAAEDAIREFVASQAK